MTVEEYFRVYHDLDLNTGCEEEYEAPVRRYSSYYDEQIESTDDWGHWGSDEHVGDWTTEEVESSWADDIEWNEGDEFSDDIIAEILKNC
jgi:hypothetical protein